MTELTCFKPYDVRGEIGMNIDQGIAYRVGRAAPQHLGPSLLLLDLMRAKAARLLQPPLRVA